jgi:hypothetical protein
VEHRDIEQFAQALLDDEALGRLDVLEVDAAPAFAEQLHAVDDLVGVLGVHLEVDRVDVGEALEQHRLAFHHRLRRERAAVAEAQNRGAVGDDGDEIALGRVVVGLGLVLGDGQHRHGDAGRIGERQIALRRHRLGGDHFQFAGAALTMEQQRFLIGKSRPVAARFLRHFNTLPPAAGPKSNVSGRAGCCSREAARRQSSRHFIFED